MKAKDKAWTAGFAIAASMLARDNMEKDLAVFLLRDAGVKLAAVEACGLDEPDISTLRDLYQDPLLQDLARVTV